MARLHGEFDAHDLASLQEKVDEFVDSMMQQGVRAWNCYHWCTIEVVPGHPDSVRWHCSVTENTSWTRHPVR